MTAIEQVIQKAIAFGRRCPAHPSFPQGLRLCRHHRPPGRTARRPAGHPAHGCRPPRHRHPRSRREALRFLVGQISGNRRTRPGQGYLEELGADEKLIDRVCFLIAHHHTYDGVDGLDYQILLEADFLVNAYEDQLKPEAIATFRDKEYSAPRRACSYLKSTPTMYERGNYDDKY